jgi:hypothetical protein
VAAALTEKGPTGIGYGARTARFRSDGIIMDVDMDKERCVVPERQIAFSRRQTVESGNRDMEDVIPLRGVTDR